MADLIVLGIRVPGSSDADLRGVVAAVAASGGVWCGVSNGTALARFDADDPWSALEGALQSLDAADDSGGASGSLCLGEALALAASGELDDAVGPAAVLGEAVDRAQALALRARPGELLLDRALKDLVEPDVIFARSVRVEAGTRAWGLDRRVALKSQATEIARSLQAPHDIGLEPALRRAGEILSATPSGLRISSVPGTGGTGLADAALGLFPTSVLLDAGVGPSEPLGAVSAALRTRLGKAADALQAQKRVSAETRVLARGLSGEIAEAVRRASPVVADLAAGRMRPVPAVVDALVAYAGALDAVGFTPIVRAEVDALDTESIEVLRRLHERKAPLKVVLLGPDDPKVPQLPALEPAEWTTHDARALAAAMLGVPVRTAWLDRLVSRGALCPRGTLDAVRDAVEEGMMLPGGGLAPKRLRAPPRRPKLERVLSRRIARLPAVERTVLSAVALVGNRGTQAILEFVGVALGIGRAEMEDALVALEDRGFVSSARGRPAISGRRARAIVRAEVPAELRLRIHGAAAQAIRVLYPNGRRFAALTHLAGAGERAAVTVLAIDAAQEALESGLAAAALRALDFDPRPTTADVQFRHADIRERAFAAIEDAEARMVALAEMQAIAQAADEPAWMSKVAARHAEAALAGREVAEAERWAEMAVAAGGSASLVDRLRALTDLAQGDLGGAVQLFERAAARDRAAGRTEAAVRARLGSAIAELSRGNARAAAVGALEVLAEARRMGDRRAEWFGLRLLAEACSRAGLADVADRLTRAAGSSPG